MVDFSLLALPVATVLGFLSGLGTGGGSILILWLTLILNIPTAEARVMNLMFFIPSALIACIFRWKQDCLKIRTLIPGILAGCATSALCTFLTLGKTPEILQNAFGIMLIYIGIKEIIYKRKGS